MRDPVEAIRIIAPCLLYRRVNMLCRKTRDNRRCTEQEFCMSENDPHRRDFLKTAGAAGLALKATASAFGKSATKSSEGRVIGANDRINVGVIGYGGRGE